MARKSNDQKQAEKEMAQFDRNYASNSRIADRAMARVKDSIHAAKTARKNKEAEWLEDLRLWACQNSDSQMYVGRSNLIIPELNNQVESSVGQFQSGLFPVDDYIGAIPMPGTDQDEAKDIRDAVFHELDRKNDLPCLMESYQRQKVLFGTAFLKVIYEKKTKNIVLKDPVKGYAAIREVPEFQGVKVKSMDTFHTYAWPETCENIQDCDIVFDESFISLRHLKRDKNYYIPNDDVKEVNQEYADYGWVDTIRMTIANLASSTAYREKKVLTTEVWCDFDIVEGEYVPCVITIANYNQVIRVQRNPFWHQLKPYLAGRYVKGPAGEFYGHSLAERLRSLQYMITDIGNQTMDSLTFSLNPIAIIDPGYAGDVNSFKLQPGARWFANPQGVDMKTFPDISSSGFQGMQQMRAMIQQFSDLAPSTAPQLTGKVRSATQAQAVQSEMNANMKNMIRSDEFEVLSPLCYMTHMLLRQFQTEDMQILTQGVEHGQWITKMINPNVLHKDVKIVWRGSEVAQADAVRNQQILSAFNMAMQVAQVMPNTIDLPELFKRVMYENFNMKDLNIFIADKEKKTIDPEVENIQLNNGEEVKVNPGDDYEKHMQAHVASYKEAESIESKLAHLKHIEQHDLQKKAKDLIEQQKAQVQSLQAQAGALKGEQSGGSQPPQFAKEGNPFQAASSPAQLMQGIRPTPNTGGM